MNGRSAASTNDSSLSADAERTKEIFEEDAFKKRLLAHPSPASVIADNFGFYTTSLSSLIDKEQIYCNDLLRELSRRHHAQQEGSKTQHVMMVAILVPMYILWNYRFQPNGEERGTYIVRKKINAALEEFFRCNFMDNKDTVTCIKNSLQGSAIIMIYKSKPFKDITAVPSHDIFAVGNYYSTDHSVYLNHIAVNLQVKKAKILQFKKIPKHVMRKTNHTHVRFQGFGTCLMSIIQYVASHVNLFESSPIRRETLLPIYLQAMLNEPSTIQFYVRNGFRAEYVDTERCLVDGFTDLGITEEDTVIHRDVLNFLPMDLRSQVIPYENNNDLPFSGIVIQFVKTNNDDNEMVLMLSKELIVDHHVIENKIVPDAYGDLGYGIISSRRTNLSSSEIKEIVALYDKESTPPEGGNVAVVSPDSQSLSQKKGDTTEEGDDSQKTCGGCGKKDKHVMHDFKCMYCMKSQHPSCCRRTDRQDRIILRYSRGIPSQNPNSHPFYVVCKRCDMSRLKPSDCNCMKLTQVWKKNMPVVCYQYKYQLPDAHLNRCHKCNQAVHAQCAKWVNNEDPTLLLKKVPICSPCAVTLENEHKRGNDGRTSKKLEMLEDNRRANFGFQSGQNIIPHARLGKRHKLEQFMQNYVETDWRFRDVCRRIPMIGPLELFRFVDPVKEVHPEKNNGSPPKLYVTKNVPTFAPPLSLHEGALLWRRTYLNDSIITAYSSICNSLTEEDRSCIFLGPEITFQWEELDVENHNQIKKRRDQEMSRMITARKGNIGRSVLSNRTMSINEVFDEGYKAAYFVFNLRYTHYFGVYLTPDKGDRDNLQYQIIDSNGENPYVISKLTRYFQYKFPEYGIEKIQEVPVRHQKDNYSCGVQQCKFMADIALGVSNWRTVPCSSEEMDIYRLIVARRLLNFEGTTNLNVCVEDTMSNDYYVRNEAVKKVGLLNEDSETPMKEWLMKQCKEDYVQRLISEGEDIPDPVVVPKVIMNFYTTQLRVMEARRKTRIERPELIHSDDDSLDENDNVNDDSSLDFYQEEKKRKEELRKKDAKHPEGKETDNPDDNSSGDKREKTNEDVMGDDKDLVGNSGSGGQVLGIGKKIRKGSEDDEEESESLEEDPEKSDKDNDNSEDDENAVTDKAKKKRRRLQREVADLQECRDSMFAEKKPKYTHVEILLHNRAEKRKKQEAKKRRKQKETEELQTYEITDEKVLRICKEQVIQEKENEEREPHEERELTPDEMLEWVARCYFENQWTEYRLDQRSKKKNKRNQPEAKNLKEFCENFDREIALWSDPAFLKKQKGYNEADVERYKLQLETSRNSVITMLQREVKLQLSQQKTDQIVCMKYVARRRTKHAGKDRVTTVPGHYVGALDKGNQEKLHKEWVEENVEKSVLTFLKNNSGVFYRLPAGSVILEKGPEEPLAGRWQPPPRPDVIYLQGMHRSCVFDSFASCLHYLGNEDLGKYIHVKARKYSKEVMNLKLLRETVQKFIGKQPQVRRFKNKQYDILKHNNNQADAEFPTVFVLQGKDGNCEHAVTITGIWIFDSNLKHALPLTKRSLDWCVRGEYSCVKEAVRFYLKKK